MKEEGRRYDPETAADLYDELGEAMKMMPDCRKVYQAMSRTFLKSLELTTRFEGVRFSGPFAKTDYLLKEHHASKSLQRSVNDARVRLRNQKRLTDAELAANCLYDFQAVCRFVSLVFKVPVPGMLEVRFPEARMDKREQLKAECLRVIVNRWDDTFFYANADEENTGEVTVFYAGTTDNAVYRKWDWSYLGEYLQEGTQLNLIRPREKDGVLYPELIILEPDYLVDISAVAACFESYAVSPLNHLLNKLKSVPATPAIVLGNLASQFLDEGLYYYPEDCSYSQSVQRFFKKNAMSLLTAGLGSDFHTGAQQQKQHIQYTLRNALPQVLRADGIRFDASEVMVEPSFFSEMLGLQGRMDFLQLAHKVLIEQKSGKGGFPQHDPETPVSQEKHYVQLLLYMLLIRYNYREQYERNNRELHAFLLYSKYKNGLLGQGFAPDLVFAAIEVRNGIVAREFAYTRDGISVLEHLTANALNEKGTSGVLWERYQRPQIEALLSPIHLASALERAYYLRFLTFLETEHLLAKVGNQTKENSGFADKWYSSLEDKLLAGNIYNGLTLLSPSPADQGRVDQVVLRLKEHADNDISNFRTGDIVILYPYAEGEEPDARRTMVFRGTIARIEATTITLSLRAAQTDARVFWYQGERKWAVEHDFFESSFSSLYRGMHAFLSAPQERKDLLLLQRRPACDETAGLRGDYGAFTDLALRVRQARDLFLIIGPPGTGKTSYGLMSTLREELLCPEACVLLLAYTNRAVDEICGKLIESQIDFVRIGGRFSCEEACRPYLFESRVQDCPDLSRLQGLVAATRVFVGTTSAVNSHLGIFRLRQFSLAIIDEASQLLEPHLMGLLSAKTADGTCAIRKMVMIGDHKQLPAVVGQGADDARVNDPILNQICLTDCRTSLFERLLKQYRDDPHVVYMLTRQGRMHHDIAQFPNEAFYQGRLQEVPLSHQTTLLPACGHGKNGIDDLLLTRRLAFVSVPPPKLSASDKVNRNEAEAIAATVVRIYRLDSGSFAPMQTVGIIVPYRNQIAEIRKAIDAYDIPVLHDITIDTVERYQGSQRDYIIYGFTIQKQYQLNFLTDNVFEEDGCLIDRKLNVAMTRAREHLLIFGNPQLLARNAIFSRLMAFIQQKQGFFSMELSEYVQGRFTVPKRVD